LERKHALHAAELLIVRSGAYSVYLVIEVLQHRLDGEIAIRALRLRYGLSASRLGCRLLVNGDLGGNSCSNGHQKENRCRTPADHLRTIGALP
jgi:hypothetical protein